MVFRVSRGELEVFRKLIAAVAKDDRQSFVVAYQNHRMDQDAILRGKAIVVGLALCRSALGRRRLTGRLPDENERIATIDSLTGGRFKDVTDGDTVAILVEWACRAAPLSRISNADRDAASAVVVGSHFLINNSSDWALRYKRFSRYARRNISLAEQFSTDGALWTPNMAGTSE